jgi:hypothetical protein
VVEEIVRLTLHETPAGETHWTCRTMAARAGVSPATVQRIWSARGLQPHRVETFKLSGDPRFEEKLTPSRSSGQPQQNRSSRRSAAAAPSMQSPTKTETHH